MLFQGPWSDKEADSVEGNINANAGGAEDIAIVTEQAQGAEKPERVVKRPSYLRDFV